MKIKLDENIPLSLVEALEKLGHQVESVYSQHIKGIEDFDLWSIVNEEERFLITQDLDFSDIRKFKPGAHAGILLVRLKKPGRLALENKIIWLFKNEDSDNLNGNFIVLSDNKLRIRKP